MIPSMRAFSLIELIVVMVILTVLVSLILPTLSRARVSATNVACSNNLRQSFSLIAVYANERNQHLPLGYRGGVKQWNTMIYSGTSGRFVLFGRLYVAGFMSSPQTFYCPAETAPAQSFDSSQNPWPPGTLGVNVQGGYASNPLDVDWAFGDNPAVWPRLDRLGDPNPALLADGVGLPARVDSRHRNGVNILHVDGHVRWADRKDFDEWLSQCVGLAATNNVWQTAIWKVLSNRNIVAGP